MSPVIEKHRGELAHQAMVDEFDGLFKKLEAVELIDMGQITHALTSISKAQVKALLFHNRTLFAIDEQMDKISDNVEEIKVLLQKVEPCPGNNEINQKPLWLLAKHSPWAAAVIYLTYAAMKMNGL